MNIKTWSHKLIQTYGSLHELSQNKKVSYKACMVTYQIGDWIKAGVNQGGDSMVFETLSLFQTEQIVPSIPSKLMPVCNNFLNHKISFWKQKNRIDMILFCIYIIDLQSCDLVVCVALELCSRFLKTWTFFLNVLKRYLKPLKVRRFWM